ncbi:MAG: DNA replication protein [Clostridia bacterium]|nr:DNA replication protein [Clostridia bacterium]
MAERRMFNKKISDSDAFTEMPAAAQALYFHLNQGADDDGFNNQIQNAMFKAHASVDDLKLLLIKNFIIRFESGVIVIKHWRMHNTLRKDRYTPTNFQEELMQLGVKGNGSYTFGCQMVAKRLPNGCHRLGKDSIDKYSIDNIYCADDAGKTCQNAPNFASKEEQAASKSHQKASQYDDEFEEIWKLYPNKKGKEKARSAYFRARKDGFAFETIKQGVESYAKECESKGGDKKYIKHGSTWFGNKCWNDEYYCQDAPNEPTSEAFAEELRQKGLDLGNWV